MLGSYGDRRMISWPGAGLATIFGWSKILQIQPLSTVWIISRLTRGRTAKPVSRDQTLRRERGQGNVCSPGSADHEQDWQPYPVDPYFAICDDHTCLRTLLDV